MKQSDTASSRLVKEITTMNALSWWENNKDVYDREKDKMVIRNDKKSS